MKTCKANECKRKAVSKELCDMHYRRLLKRGSIDDRGSRTVDTGTPHERFSKKYTVNPETGCWIWNGSTRPNEKGSLYGRMFVDGKAVGAHRFSFELHVRELLNGEYVCHRCDTPICVNPKHLFASDHIGNMRDMVSKKRSFRGSGENKKGRAKLTNAQAEEIRKATGPQWQIAKKFGVAQTSVSRIKRGISYASQALPRANADTAL